MALGWLWWRAWFPFLAAAVCLAGVALGSIHILCGKRGTWRHRPSLCGRRGNFGTGLALVARLVPVVAAAVCRIWTHRPPFSVVGAALGDIGIHFVWQAWHLWHWAGSGGAFDSRCRRACLCGRRGMWKDPFCVARVAFGDIGLHFVWQVWHLWHWAGSGGALCSRCRRGWLCGRRGIWKHRPPFCVAGVALGDIDLHFVWQASRLWHWAGSCGALCSHCRRACFCGGRGVWKHPPPFCVAHVAFGDIDLHFVWQGSFPSSSCTCSRHYVASGCFDARAEKQPFACRRHLRWTVSFHDSPGSSLSAIINCFAAKTRSCREDRPLWSWRNCLWPHMPHSHFTHNSFTHNALTHN